MLIETENYIDASQAAEILGVGRARISQLCASSRFPGQVKIGHFWAIPINSVKNFERQKPGKNSCQAKSEKEKYQELLKEVKELRQKLKASENNSEKLKPEVEKVEETEEEKRAKLMSLIQNLDYSKAVNNDDK